MKESTNFRSFINSVEQHIHCLASLEIPVKEWDAPLIQVLLSKLDLNATSAWNLHVTTNTAKNIIPSYESFITFLSDRADTFHASKMSPIICNNLQTKAMFESI